MNNIRSAQGSGQREIKITFGLIVAIFAAFLVVPLGVLLIKAFAGPEGFTLGIFTGVIKEKGFSQAFFHSLFISASSAVTVTIIAFIMAYCIHFTNTPKVLKKIISTLTVFPMLLPTFTYGFAIIYSFGKQGLITRILGKQLFDIYGFGGLFIGYVIYTIPTAFLILNNTMNYIEKKTFIVSKMMGDRSLSTFWIAVLRPLLGTLAGAFVQAFFLSFTDFGIPASVGGEYNVIATVLYNKMLGGIPDFGSGAVVATVMLLPSVLSICIMRLLERYNIRYDMNSKTELEENHLRDWVWTILSFLIVFAMLSIFAVIFVVPMVEEWPYKVTISLEHFIDTFKDRQLVGSYVHSVVMAALTALIGTTLAFGAALITARSRLGKNYKRITDSIALLTSAIPGMVLGVAYMFVFPGTPLQNTMILMIVCNIVHYFSTPYMTMKNALMKMNAGWETTAKLMGDSWIKTVLRIIAPNAVPSLLETFGYYFVNAMVTISALVFIAGARTMVLTTKMKQLQYINKFNEVFVLSLLILLTNLFVKILINGLTRAVSNKKEKS